MRRTRSIEPGSDAWGRALEHLVFLELRSWIDYRGRDNPLTYWRSQSGFEVDFLIDERVAYLAHDEVARNTGVKLFAPPDDA